MSGIIAFIASFAKTMREYSSNPTAIYKKKETYIMSLMVYL